MMCIWHLLRSRRICSVMIVISSIGTAVHVAAFDPAGKDRSGGSRTSSLNLFERHKEEYVAPGAPTIVNIAPAAYLTMAGRGAPEGEEFRKKIGVMFGVAYGIKMKSQFSGKNFTVSPLEGLWWGNKDKHSFLDEPRETWNWKLLIRLPEFITAQDVATAAQQASRMPGDVKPEEMQLERLHEGKCVQVLHVGPYATESKTIAAMRAFAKKRGLSANGVHHEIYLSDPNTTPPDKLRTILRQPVK